MSSSNSRIAKNTAFLYIRMLVVMGITLYTSRVVLDVLGIDNYGIYNIVGGIVILFTFLSSAMTTATQRYLCTSIGEGNFLQTQHIFSSSIIAHILLIALLLLIAETLGLWFVHTQLSIPPGREYATDMLYQISVFTALLNVYRIPFTASVLAWERMSFYAWSGIVEVILKLAILWPLAMLNTDKLILYGILLLIINLIITLWYIHYSHFKLKYTQHKIKEGSTAKVKEIFKFAGWSSFSALANIGSRQGLNILINIFYGVAVNAAMGVMTQVSTTVYQFIQNFMVALNPPLMKEYARSNFDEVRQLLVVSSKFSFYLMLILTTPLVFNMDSILHLWLEEVPPLTGPLCALSLIALMPNTIGGPIWTIMQASGRIQRYQIIISVIIISNIPAFYILLKSGIAPQYTLLVQLLTNLIVSCVGAFMSIKLIGMPVGYYVRQILLPTFGSLIICWAVIYIVLTYGFTTHNSNILTIAGFGIAQIGMVICIVWYIGLNKAERALIRQMIIKKFLHR